MAFRSLRIASLGPLLSLVLLVAFTRIVGAESAALPCPPICIATDPGGLNGTVALPAQCPYQGSPFVITDGLPVGSTIECDGTMGNFVNIVQFPGGSLGGGFAEYEATLQLDMRGTGGMTGYVRTISIPMNLPNSNQMHFAPRTPGTTPQSFDTDMFRLFGQVSNIGDPDFDLLRIVAGTDFGHPSPGHTTLTKQGATNNWEVESFFDIEYRIDFVGSPGGPLGGMSGSTTGTIRISNAGHHFWTDGDPHKMHYPQLPDPAGWDVFGMRPMILADDWQCGGTGPVKDLHFWGSYLDDNYAPIDSFNISIYSDVPAGITTPYSHPGQLLWQRNITDWCERVITPATLEGWYEPATGLVIPNNHNNFYQYDIELRPIDWFFQDQGTIYWLCITANLQNPILPPARWGWKSTQNHFNDDAVWLASPPPICPAPDNGIGTVDLPAQCPYVTENGTFDIIDGLNPGDRIMSQGSLENFFNVTRSPGGPLGGEVDGCNALLKLNMQGTGSLSGFSRSIAFPFAQCQMWHGPRTPGMLIQDFPSEMGQLFGEVIGDPDFDLLRITAGTGFGLPSPGHTTLTKMLSDYNVESFFDITYRIDFVGHSPGPLSGHSGSTTATIRIHQGGPAPIGGSWTELFEPPLFQQSMDLAFVITDGTAPTSGCCDTAGDADNDASITIGDAVYLIGYIFLGGPAPVCPQEADADGDASITIGDAVYIISYIFLAGPAPICGP